MTSGASPLPDRTRPATVAAMFGQIAARYDLLNTLISLGLDAGWRARAVAAAALPAGGRALDVGTGTGALARALARAAPGAEVIGLDFTPAMLALAVRWRPPGARLRFLLADALALPFPAEQFDCVTSAFVIRNVADRLAALREQARVLKPGGRVVCLEATWPRAPLFRPLFRAYFRYWVPVLGGLLAGNARAYTYLPESVEQFPRPEAFAALLREAGFSAVRYELLGLGTVALHVGVRP
jgi:demethylmenaquinone methyltransferase/2-methoxy-6-polyprenyl-1,4-benzoquinol methylase